MANDATLDPMAWATAMQKTQGELLRQWSDLSAAWAGTANATGGSGTGAAPGAMPGADIARRFMTQFEQYLGISRALWELVGKSAAASDADQRVRLFNEGLSALQHQFAGMWAATPFGAPLAGVSGPFGFTPPVSGNPFAAMGAWPGASSFAMPAGTPGMGSWFDWPALGPAREHQESWQRLAQVAARCTQAQMKLAAQWNEIIANGLRELGTRLTPRLQSGATPGSMKEMYDLWVEAAETVYAKAAHGSAFMQAQAELANAASQLRTAQRELLEEWSRQFDLPTRAELNTLHQQVRELQAALQKLGTR
jgi:class III poly(R)-hydroxyalkanoic acid synthase PhaE subunit